MQHEKAILDVITPLIKHKEEVKIILMDQDNLRDHLYIVYCNPEDLPRLIGRKGSIANSIREVINILAKLENKRIMIKFEAKQ